MHQRKNLIAIGEKKVGEGEPCFIIAEAGVNHNGDLSLAKKLIDAAYETGADAIKFQTFKTEKLVTRSAESADYQKGNSPTVFTQFEMLKRLEFSENDFIELRIYAKTKNIQFLSTAFDEESVDLLKKLNVPAFKIPSGEITNFPMLKKVSSGGKPVLLSTGMSTLEEVREAINCLRINRCPDIVILHCTSSYPAPYECVNLRAMDTLHDVFNLPVGYSDHTQGILVPIAAVARGACVLEKHFTLDRNLPGPDHAASLEPGEFRQMVSAIRQVEKTLGVPDKKPESCELKNRNLVRKSVVATMNITKGALLSNIMLTLKRPGTGIEPRFMNDLIGKHAKSDIKKDTVISWDMVE